MGDFNLDLLKFNIHTPTEEFVDAMFSYGLIPKITKPTRTQNNTATLIDNLFTSSLNVDLSGILINDISDHHMVFALEEINTDTPEGKIKRPDMSNKNITAFCDTQEKSEWDFILVEKDVNKAYEYFYSRINATADISFPLKITKEKKVNKAPWMTPSLIISKKYKNKLLIKKTKNPTVENTTKYKNYKNLYNKICRHAKFKFTRETFTGLKNDTKKYGY